MRKCYAVCAYFGCVGQRVLLLLWSLSLLHGTAAVFLSSDGGDIFPISFYIMLYSSVYVRGPKVTAICCMGLEFAPKSEMKVTLGLCQPWRRWSLVELVSFSPVKAHFPLPVERAYYEKGLGAVKTNSPLSVSGFSQLS